MKKIGFITGGLSGGGQERALVNFANLLVENNYEVLIICLFRTDNKFLLDDRISVYFPDYNRRDYHRLLYAYKQIFYVRNIVKREKVNTIISFGDWYNAFSLFSTLFIKVDRIITNRMGPNLEFEKIIHFSNKLLYPFADCLIVQTERAKLIFQQKYNLRKVVVIENIITQVDLPQTNYGKKNIISVGRLSREKGHAILIEAFAKTKKLSDWKLVIVGEGLELKDLQAKVHKLGITDKVSFVGFQSNVFEYYNEGSIFVLPSFYEGFPNALLEAMSLGMACVASDCIAGPSEIIQDEYDGLLFEVGNVDELTSKLNSLMLDEQFRQNIGANAKEIVKRYTRENTFIKLNNLLLNESNFR